MIAHGSREHTASNTVEKALRESPTGDQSLDEEHTIDIVVAVYRGERTLDALVSEIRPLTLPQVTRDGNRFRVAEVVLVHDSGPDRSDRVIRRIASEQPFVRAIWLSKNFGQHAATIAGMISTGSEWIVTLDEDGQFAPSDIGSLLDTALTEQSPLVYALPVNPPPHGAFRNLASRTAHFLATRVLSDGSLAQFSSFRLMLGEIGRSIASYVGPGVYLDVALSWAFPRVAYCSVRFRDEFDSKSGYSFRGLLRHFWRLVVSIGPRPLRLVSLTGICAAVAGVGLALALLVEKLLGGIKVQGWTSLAVLVLVIGGLNLVAIGVIAEYVGAVVGMAMGKPLYMTVSDPATSPASRAASRRRRSTTGDATTDA